MESEQCCCDYYCVLRTHTCMHTHTYTHIHTHTHTHTHMHACMHTHTHMHTHTCTHTHTHTHTLTHTHTHTHTQISAGLQVVEFLEGEPCKFILTTGDHRMSLKANTLEVKNEFVRALRTIILEKSKDNFLPRKGNSLTVDAWPRDLQVPSPLPSPLPQRRMAANGGFLMDGVESPPGSAIFERVSLCVCVCVCVCVCTCTCVCVCVCGVHTVLVYIWHSSVSDECQPPCVKRKWTCLTSCPGLPPRRKSRSGGVS